MCTISQLSASITFLSSEEQSLAEEERLRPEDRKEIWSELCKYSREEMRKCYALQQGGTDVVSQVTMDSIMQKFQEYVTGLKDLLKDTPKQVAKSAENSKNLLDIPLLTTPWEFMNEEMTVEFIPDILEGGLSHIASLIKILKFIRISILSMLI